MNSNGIAGLRDDANGISCKPRAVARSSSATGLTRVLQLVVTRMGRNRPWLLAFSDFVQLVRVCPRPEWLGGGGARRLEGVLQAGCSAVIRGGVAMPVAVRISRCASVRRVVC